jgi:hypothetical protein
MAQPGSASRGFSGRILYVQEATPGTEPTNPAYVKFSDFVQSVELSMDPKDTEYRDIGSYDVQQIVQGVLEYGLKVTYLLHINRATQLNDAVARLADTTVQSSTIEVSLNQVGTTPSYFTFSGCKPETAEVKCDVGKAVEVTITYKALSCTTSNTAPAIGTGSRETAALGSLSTFAASTITRGGSQVGFITRSAKFTITNKLTIEGTDGQQGPKFLFEGGRDAKGSVDISVDDGGKALWDLIVNGTEAAILFQMGATSSGAPTYTFSNARFEKANVQVKAGDAYIKTSQAWVNRGSGGASGITIGTA